MVDTPQEVLQFRLQHPSHLAPGSRLWQRRQGLGRASPRPSPTRAREKILLVHGGEHLGHTALERPVGHTRHPQRALVRRPRLREIDPPDGRCVSSFAVHGWPPGRNPGLAGLLCLRHRLAISPGGRIAGNRTAVLPDPLPGAVMGQRCTPELWLPPSLRCYAFQSRCHDWVFCSLPRSPSPPAVGSACCPRTRPSLRAASPWGRLSRPQSPLSPSDFRQVVGASSPSRLSDPTRSACTWRLSLVRLQPCGDMPAVRTPAAPQHPRPRACWDAAFPIARRGRPLRPVRLRGECSVHLRSGLLPPCLRFAVTVTGHHARLGTWLLARLYQGGHLRPLCCRRLQGAPPTPPDMRVTYPAVRSLQHALACQDTLAGRSPRQRHARSGPLSCKQLVNSLCDRSGLPCVCAGTMPSADSSPGISADSSALSPFPWHATSRGPGEASRGKRSSRPCTDAGGIKHAPTVDGGLCGRVPACPERTTPRIRFVSLAPHVRSTLPSDAPSQGRPCASRVLRLHVYLDRRLALPSMTACTAHTRVLRR